MIATMTGIVLIRVGSFCRTITCIIVFACPGFNGWPGESIMRLTEFKAVTMSDLLMRVGVDHLPGAAIGLVGIDLRA